MPISRKLAIAALENEMSTCGTAFSRNIPLQDTKLMEIAPLILGAEHRQVQAGLAGIMVHGTLETQLRQVL
jgi:hypothetical protein